MCKLGYVIMAVLSIASVIHARPQPAVAQRNVAIVVHEGVELLDFAGPAEVFANVFYRGQRAFKVYTVAPSLQACKSQQNVTVVPEYSIDNCPPPAIIVIPGGATQNLTNDPRFMDWVRHTSPKCEVTLTVCTGAFVPAELGMLDGMEATTHYNAIGSMRQEHPKVKVRDNVRFVDNGKIVTTAGISAGIDGALHVVSRLTNAEAAWMTARQMEYNWSPPPLPKDASSNATLRREGTEHRVYGRSAQAAEVYEKLLQTNPNDSEALLKLGQAQMGQSKFDYAAKSFESALGQTPDDPFLLSLLARAQIGAKQYDACIENYLRAIELGQDTVNNIYNLSCAYALTGQKDKAIETLARALKEGPWMKMQAVKDEDFASIREDERFKAMVAGK